MTDKLEIPLEQFAEAVAKENARLNEEIERLLSNAKSDAMWLASYHQWCKMNGCAPSSSDLIAASNALKEKKDE